MRATKAGSRVDVRDAKGCLPPGSHILAKRRFREPRVVAIEAIFSRPADYLPVGVNALED